MSEWSPTKYFSESVPQPAVGVEITADRILLEFSIEGFKVGEFSIIESESHVRTPKEWQNVYESLRDSSRTNIEFVTSRKGAFTKLRISPVRNSISMRSYLSVDELTDEEKEVDGNILLMLRLPFCAFEEALVECFRKIADAKNKKVSK